MVPRNVTYQNLNGETVTGEFSERSAPYLVRVYRPYGAHTGYYGGVKVSLFDTLDDATKFFNSRHVGAYKAELATFNGEGHTTIKTRK